MRPPEWNWPIGLTLMLVVAVITFVACEYFVGHWEWGG